MTKKDKSEDYMLLVPESISLVDVDLCNWVDSLVRCTLQWKSFAYNHGIRLSLDCFWQCIRHDECRLSNVLPQGKQGGSTLIFVIRMPKFQLD